MRPAWTGRLDHALLLVAAQAGLPASEVIALRKKDVHLGTGPHVSCIGKGRKQLITPLTAAVVAVLRIWLEQIGPEAIPVFPTRTGKSLSRDALERRLRTYVAIAVRTCPSLQPRWTAENRPLIDGSNRPPRAGGRDH